MKQTTIGIIAPSRPVVNAKNEINASIKILKSYGFNVKISKNLYKRSYYMAGDPTLRVSDIHEMFSDPEVDIVMAAAGGSCANQLLDLIDYNLIRKNKKLFIGFSDITNLLLAFYVKAGLKTIHGPDVKSLLKLNKKSLEIFIRFLQGQTNYLSQAKKPVPIKKGSFKGQMLGGNLTIINGLLSTSYSPDYTNKILFWEDLCLSPAMIDYELNQFKLSGNMKKLSGMIVGHIEEYKDTRHPEDHRLLKDILLQVTKDYDFPIIKVDWFGHNLKTFYPLVIGSQIMYDGKNNILKID